MPDKDFAPALPEGFVNAGTFNGVTTAVGPEAGVTERLDEKKPEGLVLGRYLDRKSGATQYAAMSLVTTRQGTLEIFVTRCPTEDRSRELMRAAMAQSASSGYSTCGP